MRMHQTDSLLVVVVQLPDGPRHDDGEGYTCGETRGGGGAPLTSFILLRHSDHEIPLQGFHAANMKSLSIFSSFLPERRRAPAKLCQVQSLLLGPDPHKPARTCHCVTRRETEAPDKGITAIGVWVTERHKRLHLRVEGTERCRQSPARDRKSVV